MARLIKTDGTTHDIQPTKGGKFTLDELQGFVGGYIEILYLGRRALIINEEGKLERLPRNELATALATMAGIADDDYIVGDVVLCSRREAGL